MTDGLVATSLLSRLERFEMFLGKIFVMLFIEVIPVLGGGAGSGQDTLEVEGNPRGARACALKAVVAPEAESEVTLWRMLGEECVRALPLITGGLAMLLRY